MTPIIDAITRRPLGLTCGVLLLALTLPLQGCAPLIVGGVLVGATATMHDRRSPQVILEDQQIEFEAMSALVRNTDVRDHTQLSVTSYNRTLLITGTAQSLELAERATALVSVIPKVQRVVDEIQVRAPLDIRRQAEDAFISTRVNAELFKVRLPDFDPTRVKVVTSDAVVYLMGLVTPEEAEAAAETARYVPGVQRVVKLFEYITPSA